VRLTELARRAAVIAGMATLACLSVGAVSAESPSPGTPLATPDSYTVDEDTILQVAAPGLLENDNPVFSTCVTAVDTTTLVGSADVHADGSFSFAPAANSNGPTSFTYGIATDSGLGCPAISESTATVTITVLSVNDPPTAVADSFAGLKDRTLNVGAPGVLINDSDIDGDPLSAVKASSPAHGVVTLASDGSFSYTPAAGYTGPDAFSYRASDGTATSATRIVSIIVTAIPPVPTPTPPPTATPLPTASPTPEPSASASPAPSDSGFVNPSLGPIDTGLPSPTPSPAGGPVSGEGGLPLAAIGALALLLTMLAVAAVYFVRSQRGGDEELEPVGAGDLDDGSLDLDEDR
jgi:hypothetical protein